MSAGSFFLIRKPKAGGGFLPDWYLFLRFPGQKPVQFCTGYAICGPCMAAERPGQDRERCGCQKPVRALGKSRLEALNAARWAKVSAPLLPGARRTVPTLGEVFAAVMDWHGERREDMTTIRRSRNDLRLVLATALDLWTTEIRVQGIRAGSPVPDVARIDALPVTALNKDVVREFFRLRQGGVFDPMRRDAANLSANKTLNHARCLFSKRSREFALENLAIPWEALADFLTHPLLLVPVRQVALVESEAWEAMVQADGDGDAWLGLVNRILRQTALRGVELVAARVSWLVEAGGKTWLDLRDRPEESFWIKGGATPGKVPMLADTVARIRQHGGEFLIAPEDRERIIRRGHNAFVKRFLGGQGERVQGNHRLRDFVAQYLYTLRGPQVAAEALRHADCRTTLAHYAKWRSDVPPSAAAELGAW